MAILSRLAWPRVLFRWQMHRKKGNKLCPGTRVYGSILKVGKVLARGSFNFTKHLAIIFNAVVKLCLHTPFNSHNQNFLSAALCPSGGQTKLLLIESAFYVIYIASCMRGEIA